jgi:hypothetical protein
MKEDTKLPIYIGWGWDQTSSSNQDLEKLKKIERVENFEKKNP